METNIDPDNLLSCVIAGDPRYIRYVRERVMMQSSCAPLRHVVTQVNMDGEWGKALERMAKMIGTGCMIGLIGIRGTGKTQIGVELIRRCLMKNEKARYTTATGFFMAIKASYAKNGTSEEEVLNEFCNPKLLVLDEFGKRSENEWQSNLMFELLNRRYGDMKDTVIIDNNEREAFVQSIGASLARRMDETGGIINSASWSKIKNS